jgi:transporter family-2 protein
VVTVGLFIAGQMFASLALDGLGALGIPHQPLAAPTVLGALAVLGGAAAIVFGQKGAASALSPGKLGWILLALAAGAVLPIQGAINGALRGDLGAPFVVGAVSFAVATLSMALVLLGTVVLNGAPRPRLAGLGTMPWWGWLGALCGATYVTAVFTAIPVIGTAGTVGLTVAGQQIASLFVDRYGWFRLPQRAISRLRLGGVVALLAGVALIQLS